MQARHSVISLAARARCIRLSSAVNNMSAPVSRRFLHRAVAKISVFARRLWAGLVFDGLGGVAPSNADHVLPLVAQPLSLGALGVALVVVGAPLARLLRVGGAGRGCGVGEIACSSSPSRRATDYRIALRRSRARGGPPRSPARPSRSHPTRDRRFAAMPALRKALSPPAGAMRTDLSRRQGAALPGLLGLKLRRRSGTRAEDTRQAQRRSRDADRKSDSRFRSHSGASNFPPRRRPEFIPHQQWGTADQKTAAWAARAATGWVRPTAGRKPAA